MKIYKAKKILIGFLFLILSVLPAAGENLSISQMDTSDLFITSSIDCYVRVTESRGNILDIKNSNSVFSVFQQDENGKSELKVTDIKRNSESSEGITFMLIIDNSGSMYDPLSDSSDTRINAAVSAAKNFFSSLDPGRDRAGLALFNREYRMLAKPGKNPESLDGAFSAVEKPSKEESFTELYYTVTEAAEEMGKTAGRKAVILLSDGENYPYYKKSGKSHPILGTENILPEQALKSLTDNEVTLYAVNFSSEKDIPLSEIAVASGGKVFDASNEAELKGIYQGIRESIEGEYRIKVKVPVSFSNSPKIEVVLNEEYSDSMTYSPALIFGSGHLKSFLPALMLLITGAILWAVLFFIRLEKEAEQAELTQLLTGAGRGKALEKTMLLTSANTVIGSSQSADYTITGIPEMSESHATIVHDDKTNTFTLVSSKDVRVNNRPVKKRKLNPGDVINIEGATMVFDAPDKTVVKK